MSSAKSLSYETPIHVRNTCLCLHVQRAARALARRFDEALRPFKLTNGQFSLLMSLNRPEPPAMRPVAALLAIDRTTLTAALKPLERRRLVRVSRDPADRRNRILTLTPEGRELLGRAVPVWALTHREIEAVLPSETPDALRKSLNAIEHISRAGVADTTDDEVKAGRRPNEIPGEVNGQCHADGALVRSDC